MAVRLAPSLPSIGLGLAVATLVATAAPCAVAADANADLITAFAAAAEAIRGHQGAEGGWRTAVTQGPAFEAAGSELNVFTPAVLLDLLEPVAAETGLAAALARGRAYLSRQIEPSGLVRYHGDPGPVPDVVRGCDLPGDADDTALVWRIAPRADRRLAAEARAAIERFRDDDGLYRTWLADETAYRCFYVRYAGRQWNPPDVAVEMHVYLFLAGVDPPAAGRLCEALRRRVDDDRIWIWYTVAPVIPFLREVDLANSGCVVRVPDGRLARAVAGQEPYVRQVRLLHRLVVDGGRDSGSSPEPYVAALRAAAANGFATVTQSPPLIYHNDLSAWPPHFHWSDDVGYALWLRLYAETARRFPGALPAPPAPGSR